jgi:DNA-binding SARP family transcriptional activator
MSGLAIRLFGKFSIRKDDYLLAGLDSAKVRELLSYLLLYRERSHPREHLASVLWEATSTPLARKYLRQVLWQLQSGLGAASNSQTQQLIHIEPEWVRFEPGATFWLDVEVFESAYTAARGIHGEQLEARQAQALEQAVELYRGDLLEGWYQDWCIFERERLENMWLAMLDKLMGYCQAQQTFESGIDYGMRVLRQDRARERTHRRMIRLYYLAGDRTGGLRQYQRCVEALKEELGVKPSDRTEQLYRRIWLDTFDEHRPIEQIPKLTSSLPKLISRLSRLRKFLNDAQDRISRDIEDLERALSD